MEEEYKELARSTKLEDAILEADSKTNLVKDFFGKMGMTEEEVNSQKAIMAVQEKMNSDMKQARKETDYLMRLKGMIVMLSDGDLSRLAEYKERKNVRKEWRRLAAIAYYNYRLGDLTQGMEEYFTMVRQGHEFFLGEAGAEEPDWEIVSHWEYYSVALTALESYHQTNISLFSGFLNPVRKRLKEFLGELGGWEKEISRKLGPGAYHTDFQAKLEAFRVGI